MINLLDPILPFLWDKSILDKFYFHSHKNTSNYTTKQTFKKIGLFDCSLF